MNIVYQDDRLVIINKPTGMICHRNEWTKDHEVPALQITRNTIKQQVYMVHRIDRATSGLLVFAKDKETARNIQQLFAHNKVSKTYHALCRGWVKEDTLVNRELDGKACESLVEVIAHLEIDAAVGRYDKARYSLVRLKPKTGRNHQLRRHLVHLRHPIIGDRVRGDRDHNRYFKEEVGIDRLWLFATGISIPGFNQDGHDLVVHCPFASKAKKFLLNQGFKVPDCAVGKKSNILTI